MSFKEQGVQQEDYFAKVSDIAYLAYEDQCTPCNPRLALVKDMEEILSDAYFGYEKQPGRIK